MYVFIKHDHNVDHSKWSLQDGDNIDWEGQDLTSAEKGDDDLQCSRLSARAAICT